MRSGAEEGSLIAEPPPSDVAFELGERLQRSRFGEGDGGGDLSVDLPLDRRDLVVGNEMIVFEPFAKTHDRSLGAPGLDLRLGPVELGVEHRMGAEPIGAAFQEKGAAALMDRGDRAPRGRFDRDDVHAVDLLAGQI